MFILLSDDGCMLKIDDGKGHSVDYDHTALESSLVMATLFSRQLLSQLGLLLQPKIQKQMIRKNYSSSVLLLSDVLLYKAACHNH